MPANVAVGNRGDEDEDDKDNHEACFAEAGLAAGPVDEPDEREGGCCCENCTCGTDGSNLELWARPTAVCRVGKCRGPYARLLPQQLRGDYEVPEVLKESFVISTAKA